MTQTVTTAELLRRHLDDQERVGWHLDWPEALATLREVVELHVPKEAYEGDATFYCRTCRDNFGDYEEAPCATERALVQELLLRPYATWLSTRLVTAADEAGVRRLAPHWADAAWAITDAEIRTVLTLASAVTT